MSATTSNPALPVLIITADVSLLDDLLRLATAAGVEVEVASDPGAVSVMQARASLVLLGDDVAADAVGPRRSHVLLVSRAMDDGDIWRRAVTCGAETVVMLPDGEAGLVELMADAAEGPERAFSIGVVGSSGGAGASALAAGLAEAAARRGERVCLLDTDVLGGGLDLMVGIEQIPGLRWSDFASVSGRLAAESFAASLPATASGVRVLSWEQTPAADVPTHAVESVMSAAKRAHDLVIVDLSRAAALGLPPFAAWLDTVVVVTPATVRAAAAARRMVGALRSDCADLRTVVRLSGSTSVTARTVADTVDVPLAGVMSDDAQLAEAIEQGLLTEFAERGPWASAVSTILSSVLPVVERRTAA